MPGRWWVVITLALVTRLYAFGIIPSGVYVDEAALGYNAYALVQTGRDEYGKAWPIFFRSFGTYPSGLYEYLTTPWVAAFGLNAISARLTSLIAGLVVVLITLVGWGWTTGLIVAIAPIFIFVSRAAYEPNLALMLFTLALVLARRGKYGALLIFSLSAYAYHAERFLAVVAIIYFVCRWGRKALIYAALALVLQLPLFMVGLSSGANLRLNNLANFQPKEFVRLYAAYFSPNNLFSKPDPDRQRAFPEVSVFYWWMVIPLVFGLSRLKQNKEMLALLAVSALPGAVTKDYFATLRVLPLFIGVAWVIAQGCQRLIRHKWIYGVLIVLALGELYSNLVLQRHELASAWDYEYQQIAEFARAHPGKPILIDSDHPAYVLLAFYNRYPPRYFHRDQTWLADYYSHTTFDNAITMGNLRTGSLVWEQDVYREQLIIAGILAISDSQAREHKFKLTQEIKDINGQVTYRIWQTNPAAKLSGLEMTSTK